MTEDPTWSTPKFLLVAFVVTLVVMFTSNAVLNVWLNLDVSPSLFGAPAGVVLVFLLPRWRAFRQLRERNR